MVAFKPGTSVSSNPAYAPGAMPSFDGGGALPNSLAGLQLWLDAAAPSTITSSSGSVSQWDDKSGNANNGTQGTGSAQPTTNVSTQNGKNILDYDGGDNLVLPSAIFTIPNGANTTFVVSKRTVDSGTQVVLGMFEGAGNFRYTIFYGAAGDIIFRNDDGTDNRVTSGSNTTTDMNIIQASYNGTTGQSLSINGGTAVTNTGGIAEPGIDIAGVGSPTLPLTGSIAEVIIYDRLLSAVEITQVNNYLSNKWGISI